MRRCWRDDDDSLDEDEDLPLLGMSRMFSFRPVVGSVVWSLAGSCDT